MDSICLSLTATAPTWWRRQVERSAATSAIFFLILNYIKVPFYYVADVFNFHLLWQMIWLLPMVPLGVWAGKWVVVRVSKQLFDNLILFLLIVSAFLLFFTG